MSPVRGRRREQPCLADGTVHVFEATCADIVTMNDEGKVVFVEELSGHAVGSVRMTSST